ncbi:sensor histidine kinase [Gilvimarinus sp. F26214L]|uniref:sensor histidine kinase n=1 Tax=Gilvimarinus sp. DZF01 TaxID=3461371 RepID=UPI004046130C
MTEPTNTDSGALRHRAGAFVEQNLETIFQRWEDQVRRSVPAAREQDSLLLRNHLLPYMAVMMEMLDCADVASVRKELAGNPEMVASANETHGRLRATLPGYSIDQLIEEYICLRQVLSDVLEQEALLDRHVLEVVTAANERAIELAASQFTQSLQSLRQKAISMLMHDIRNPLNVVTLGAAAAGKQVADPTVQDQLTKVVQNARRIDKMVSEFLDAVRLEAGEGLELEFAQEDLRTILKEVTEGAILAYPNRVEVAMPEHPVEGHFDRAGLARAVENLVSNAINHGAPERPVRVELSTQGQENIISVHNWGPPIDDNEREMLFVTFARGSGAKSREERGWGLGLTYVKAVAEGHGGQVRVDSSEETGTTFSMVLPAG